MKQYTTPKYEERTRVTYLTEDGHREFKEAIITEFTNIIIEPIPDMNSFRGVLRPYNDEIYTGVLLGEVYNKELRDILIDKYFIKLQQMLISELEVQTIEEVENIKTIISEQCIKYKLACNKMYGQKERTV